MLSFDFLLAERSHCDQFVEEPLVCLSELALLQIEVALVDDLDHELTEALVKLNTILPGVTLLLHDFQLLVSVTLDSNFLLVHVKCGQADDEFFIHLVSLEAGVLEHLHGGAVLFGLTNTLFVESAIDHLEDLVIVAAVRVVWAALILAFLLCQLVCNSCGHFSEVIKFI